MAIKLCLTLFAGFFLGAVLHPADYFPRPYVPDGTMEFLIDQYRRMSNESLRIELDAQRKIAEGLVGALIVPHGASYSEAYASTQSFNGKTYRAIQLIQAEIARRAIRDQEQPSGIQNPPQLLRIAPGFRG